jgi:hypothetical protein
MMLLLLSLLVLNLCASIFIGWILFQVSGQTAQNQHSLLQIQRALLAFDRPESLSVAGVAPGSSWVQSEAEVAALQERMQSESQQRVGLAPSRRSLKRPTGLPTATSP